MRLALLPLTALSLAACLTPSAALPEDAPVATGERDSGLRLSSRIPGGARVFRIGERAPLEIVLTNNSDHEIRFRYLGGWSYYNGHSLEVRRDGKPVRVRETVLLGLVPILYQAVPAGKSVALAHPGLWLGQPPGERRIEPHLLDPKPGKYQVKLYHPDAPGARKLDDSVEFEIAAAAGRRP